MIYYDVVVVGGGPSGSTIAALTAMEGHRVLLLEKEAFPRYQIGESLLPATIHGICRMLGVGDEIEQAGFVVKHGGTFKWGKSETPWSFDFAVSRQMAGPTSFAYQVERRKFDQILLDNARRVGVTVQERCSVTEVLEDGGRVRGVRYLDADGRTVEVDSRFLIDASGNKSRIHTAVGGSREYSEYFRNLALFGYFEGGKRMPAPSAGNILCVAFDAGWFWYIPLSETLTSVGAVVKRDMAEKVQGDRRKALESLVDECPLIADMLSEARLVEEGDYGEIRVRKDYSYCGTKFWRPGMALVGDAACFVDPVFSSGVHLATYSALLAARSINSVLDGTIDEETAFREFELRYRREYATFYEFLMSFYDLHVSENSYFWQAKKVTRAASSDLEAFVELVGGISSGEQAFSGSGRFQERATELADAVDRFGSMEEGEDNPLMTSAMIGDVMQESAQIQARAMLGAEAGPETPLFEGGLVSSADGMRWELPEEG